MQGCQANDVKIRICKHWEINDKVLDLSLFAICDLGAAAKGRFQSGHHQ